MSYIYLQNRATNLKSETSRLLVCSLDTFSAHTLQAEVELEI